MRAIMFLCAVGAAAQSHPSWWTYAPLEAAALVGVRWESLRESALGSAVEPELSNVFEMDFLKQSQQILLASPPFLAVASGDFPPATMRAEAAAKGLKRLTYRGVEMWASSSRDAMGVAALSGQLVLVGSRAT